MARRDVRGGSATRGFRPGSAQAVVALVLGVVAGVTGVRRGEPWFAVLFFAVAVAGGLSLWRLYRTAARDRA
jgi:hypothetical protein